MSDQTNFQGNLDTGNTDDNTSAKKGGFFEGVGEQATTGQNDPGNPIIGSTASAAEALAKAAADANAAAEKLRQQTAAQQAQAQQDQSAQSTSSDDEEFVGSGGVGSAEQLDAIRRGYAERGIADPSGLGGSGESEA